MENHPDDRHVAALAAHCGAPWIATFNLKDFALEALSGYGITAIHPDEFLRAMYRADPEVVIDKLAGQAGAIGRSTADVLRTLRKGVPNFAGEVGYALELGL